MPLVRISLRRGKPAAYLAALRDGIYEAMREVFDVPENDRFILIHQHEAEAFDCDPHYLGIERSADLVIVQIACNASRTPAQKQAFYRRVAERLAADPGLRPADVFINLLETGPANWSFGDGVAQLA
jgi:phenylpyruvate tautomerase PptA (4-oxalocrotonate tautomerase family)